MLIKDPNCVARSTSLLCALCSPQYFLTASSECVLSDQSVEHCEIYENATTCKNCEPSFYLVGNVCVKISAEVEHCLIYRKFKKCLTCVDGYSAMADGSCQVVTIPVSNCLVYLTDGVCSLCDEISLPNYEGHCIAHCVTLDQS